MLSEAGAIAQSPSIIGQLVHRDRSQRRPAWVQDPTICRFERYLRANRVSESLAQVVCRRAYQVLRVADSIETLGYCDVDQFIAQHFAGKSSQYQSKLRSALGKFQSFIWSEAA